MAVPGWCENAALVFDEGEDVEEEDIIVTTKTKQD